VGGDSAEKVRTLVGEKEGLDRAARRIALLCSAARKKRRRPIPHGSDGEEGGWPVAKERRLGGTGSSLSCLTNSRKERRDRGGEMRKTFRPA